uniref:NADH dehydrogenase subunit 7 n=1 Tax=Trapa bicornis TaxID=236974 RepID=UPI0030031010|nr:NADH dehydrogenase subunit 7 [Trapa bicornis]WRW54281.1 NADH dehydrogenase subunit 7 [Trapa incisa]
MTTTKRQIKNFTSNFGPQHPAAHGVSRSVLEMNGEVVERAEPHIGLLHRGTEKLIEYKTYLQALPYSDRLDYVSTMAQEHAHSSAVEKLLNCEVPLRAQYIRVLFREITRISNHSLALTTHAMDVGASTPFLWAFEEREKLLEFYERVSGARMHASFIRPGGVAQDLPLGLCRDIDSSTQQFASPISEYQKLITRNPIFLERVEGVGIIGGEEAINWGLSGPMLRASGIQWDLRKVDRYECYDEFDWEIQWQKEGDSLARYLVRISEMTESIQIIQQALEGIPGGPYENLEIRSFDREKDPEWNDLEYRFISKKTSPTFELPKQELYVRVEAPKGELGIL